MLALLKMFADLHPEFPRHVIASHRSLNDRYSMAYRLFRRRIIQRNRTGAPAASTPLPTGGQQNTSVMLDTVRQRLLIDSPPRHHCDTDPAVGQTEAKEEPTVVMSHFRRTKTSRTISSHIPPHKDTAGEPVMTWIPVGKHCAETNSSGSSGNLQPFSVLSTHSESQMRLAAPSLLDDYYTNLLDCSYNGVVALALGSSVYLWNSKTSTLVGHLAPKLSSRWNSSHSQTILSLCWSSDGRWLCIGNRRGDIELWDVEHGLSVKCLSSHQSGVRALSWKQNLISRPGHIQHCDPRTEQWGTPLKRRCVQFAWSDDDQLASGSTEACYMYGQHINTHLQEPVTTMRQPTSVKVTNNSPRPPLRPPRSSHRGYEPPQVRATAGKSHHNGPASRPRAFSAYNTVIINICALYMPSELHCFTVTYLEIKALPWDQSQKFCQKHFVDLAVMSTEREYLYLINDTYGERMSFWIGLQRRKNQNRSWTWVDGEGLHYNKWLNINATKALDGQTTKCVMDLALRQCLYELECACFHAENDSQLHSNNMLQ
ncbi:hypothetical protein WMY93_005286 [Mugilogobius chulae]|uniref:C-type lectin domain-containing protein n=1 Tax=Mugilogobius chulae TaxID=88201 RepID=A0AAW0PQU7_9GOBI